MNWAKQLLELFGENGEGWTRNVSARNCYDEMCSPMDLKATKWCLLGACCIVESKTKHYEDFSRFLLLLGQKISRSGWLSISNFNDFCPSFDDIKKMLAAAQEEYENELG